MGRGVCERVCVYVCVCLDVCVVCFFRFVRCRRMDMAGIGINDFLGI